MVTRSARGRVDGGNSGAAAEALGMQMVSVTTTGGGDDALRGVVPSAPLLRRDDEPKKVDAPPEAEPRPLSFARLFGGGGSNASAPVPRPRERPASLSVGPACSNMDAATATAFRGGCGVGWDRQGAISCASRHKVDDTQFQRKFQRQFY